MTDDELLSLVQSKSPEELMNLPITASLGNGGGSGNGSSISAPKPTDPKGFAHNAQRA